MELQNSTVLVTGATGNMGPSVTDSLVARGADVVGTYVSEREIVQMTGGQSAVEA